MHRAARRPAGLAAVAGKPFGAVPEAVAPADRGVAGVVWALLACEQQRGEAAEWAGILIDARLSRCVAYLKQATGDRIARDPRRTRDVPITYPLRPCQPARSQVPTDLASG